MAVQENAVYGKVPYFIQVCREGKSERMSCRLIYYHRKQSEQEAGEAI